MLRDEAEAPALAANAMITREAGPLALRTGHAFVSLTGNLLASDVCYHVLLLVIVV